MNATPLFPVIITFPLPCLRTINFSDPAAPPIGIDLSRPTKDPWQIIKNKIVVMW
jgi:hypothetical protein